MTYKTDAHGGRILGVGRIRTNIFGESQALAMDSDALPLVYQELGVENAIIYATPNNGPYEWLRRLAQGNYRATDHHLYVINLGFDIFRLGPEWSAKNLAGISLTSVEKSIDWPRFLSLRLMLSQYRLRRLSLAGDDRDEKLALFLSNSSAYERNLRSWAGVAAPILAGERPEVRKQLLVISPYWLDTSTPHQEKIAENLLDIVACGLRDTLPVVGVSFKYTSTNITDDKRHFRQMARPHFVPALACGGD